MAVRLGIETGGTFTDLIGIDDATGTLVVAKTPSTPAKPGEEIMNAITLSGAEPRRLEAISIGTTVATNALLQRNGATVIYVTTAGFTAMGPLIVEEVSSTTVVHPGQRLEVDGSAVMTIGL